MPNHFNIRVYGIVINEKNEVLVSDEFRNGTSFTKFPGGGLEFGEGTKDALKREFLEEFNLQIEVENIFYINDFLQISAFNPDAQLISIYYYVSFQYGQLTLLNQKTIPLTEEGEQLRWIKISKLTENNFTFPIDKKVAKLIINDDNLTL